MENKPPFKFIYLRAPPKTYQQASSSQTQTQPCAIASNSTMENQQQQPSPKLIYVLIPPVNPQVGKGQNAAQRTNNGGQNRVQPYALLLRHRKRSSSPETNMNARTRVRFNNPEERQWGYSTTLVLYDDPWKIKKVLTESDLRNLSRLLIATDLVEDLVLPALGAEAKREAKNSDKGTQVGFWDVDTETMHYLVLKRWPSNKNYVFMGKWNHDFVKRRCLKKGDEIGLHWDFYKHRFDFSVLLRAPEILFYWV